MGACDFVIEVIAFGYSENWGVRVVFVLYIK